MKTLVKEYIFDKTNKTITFAGSLYPESLEEILLVTNVTTGDIIYNFADKLRGGSFSNKVLSLVFNTSSMNNSDNLQIFIESNDYQQDVLAMFSSLLKSTSYAKDAADRMRTIVDGGSLTIYTRASGTPLNGSSEPWYSATSWNGVDGREQLMELSNVALIQSMQRWVKS